MRTVYRSAALFAIVVVALIVVAVPSACSDEAVDEAVTAVSGAASSLLEGAQSTAPSVQAFTGTSLTEQGTTTSTAAETTTTTVAPGEAFGIVSGTVTFAERMSLPSDASVRVSLEEIPPIDPEAVLVEQVIISRGRQVPIPFELRYEKGTIDPDTEYGVVATIFTGAGVLFRSASPVAVITRGNPETAEIVVEQVGP